MADQKPRPNDKTPSNELTEEIVAYLDGELDPSEADAVAARLSLDPKLRSQADAFQRTWDILDILPRPQPSPNFAARTVSQLAAVPDGASGMQAAPLGSAPMPTYPPRRIP